MLRLAAFDVCDEELLDRSGAGIKLPLTSLRDRIRRVVLHAQQFRSRTLASVIQRQDAEVAQTSGAASGQPTR